MISAITRVVSILDVIRRNVWRLELIEKDPCIYLVSNSPTNKHYERSHRLSFTLFFT